MKKISFDFDGTLGHKDDVQEFCKQCLKDSNLEVYITTRRYSPEISKLPFDQQPENEWWVRIGDNNWKEVFKLADEFGIKRENIFFCNMEDKVDYFENKDFYLHLDDDKTEVTDINEFTSTFCVWVKDNNWLLKAKQLINQIS